MQQVLYFPKISSTQRIIGNIYVSDANAKPKFDVYTLYGALDGGPKPDDIYTDNRSNCEMSKETLYYIMWDINFFFLQLILVKMFKIKEIFDFQKEWPPKPQNQILKK